MPAAIITPSRSLIVPRRGFRKPARPVLDPNDPINRGLVGCWLLGDVAGSGSRITQDLSPFGNNATLVNGPTFGAAHHGGLGLTFNGSSNYVKIAANAPGTTNKAISLVAWVNFSSLTNSYNGVLSRNDNVGHFYQILVKSSGKIAIYVGTPTTIDYDGTGSHTLSTGKWYCLVLIYDSAGGLAGYVNGAQDGTAGAGGALPTSINAILSIGADTVTAGRYAACTIDGVRQYNRSLTKTEIQRLYGEPYAGIYANAPGWLVGSAGAASFLAPPPYIISQAAQRAAVW